MTMYRHTIRLEEKLFERSDRTLSYYFDIDYFVTLAREASFTVVEIKYATVINRNRKTKQQMRRVFLHAVLQKHSLATTHSATEIAQDSPDLISACESSGNNNNEVT